MDKKRLPRFGRDGKPYPFEDRKILHICEVCGRTEAMTPAESFAAGWDYPPYLGDFGMVTPRTCPDCRTENTLWWHIAVDKTPFKDLPERDIVTLHRIMKEPDILLVPDEGGGN